MAISELIARFAEVMGAEVSLYSELLALSEEKKDILVQSKVDELSELVKKEQVLLYKLNEWEKKRLVCVTELSALTGKPSSDIALRDFAEVGDETQRGHLDKLHDELARLLKEQMRLNDLNRKIIESRLEYIHFALEAVADTQNPSQTYGKNGYGQRGNSIIDKKI